MERLRFADDASVSRAPDALAMSQLAQCLRDHNNVPCHPATQQTLKTNADAASVNEPPAPNFNGSRADDPDFDEFFNFDSFDRKA